jgi:hypothetical protein
MLGNEVMPVREKGRPRFISNGLSSARFGMFCGMVAFAYVFIARMLGLGTHGKTTISLVGLAVFYLIGGPTLGFLGGVVRTWLPGRWGRYIIGIVLTGLGSAMVVPLIPGTQFPWGASEYSVIAISALILGPILAAQHSDD